MTEYLAHFLERPEQVVVILGAAGVWLGLTSLGSVLSGPWRLDAANPVAGWAGVVVLFTLFGVLTAVSFIVLAWAAGALALVAAVMRWRREGSILSRGALRTAVLAAPLMVLVSAMHGSQWDEFSHWLPSIRFLVETHGFPDAAQPQTGASFPAYPYGWPLLSYLVARLTGAMHESAGPLLNVLLLLSLGLLVTHVIRQGLTAAAGPSDEAAAEPSWGLCALGALAAIPFNPTFAQKVALTSYADTSSAVALGFAAALGWMAVNAAAAGGESEARWRAWQMGLALTVLVALKQATFVLFVLVVGAVVVAGLRDSSVGWRRTLRLLPGMVVLPLLVYAAWRYHVATELGAAAEFRLRAPADWAFALIPEILLAMLTVLAKKGLYLGLMLIATGFGLRALWRCDTAFDRLALIVGALFTGYNGFLFFTYIAAFGPNDALRAASLWRYNMHLGAACVVFAWFGAALLWRRFDLGRRLGGAVRYLPAAAMVLVVAAPFVFAGKLRFDHEPDKPYYREVAHELAGMIPSGETFSLLDPRGSGESWVITLFHLNGRAEPNGYVSAFHDTREENLRRFVQDQDPDVILVHSVTPALNAVLGPRLADREELAQDGASYLLMRDPAGGWRVAHRWMRPSG